MWLLIIGLVLFLGIPSVRIFGDGFRSQQIELRGEGAWKGIYSLISIAGFIAIVIGYGMARENADTLFSPPSWGRGFLLIIMPIALVLIVASQLPAGYLKARFQHPMLWGVIMWAVGHLTANGDTASVILFGGLAIWALLDLRSASARPTQEKSKPLVWPDLVSVVVGLAITWAFVSFAHEWMIGVPII